MDHRLIIVAIVLMGLALSVIVPERSYECLLYDDVICLTERLVDEEAAHRALDRFVRSEYGILVPPLTAFRSDVHSEYSLTIENDAYTFTHRAASPQWSVTLEKRTETRWQIVQHSRYITRTD